MSPATWFFELYFVFVTTWQWTVGLPFIVIFGGPYWLGLWLEQIWPGWSQGLAEYQVLMGFLVPAALFSSGVLFLLQMGWRVIRLVKRSLPAVKPVMWLAILTGLWVLVSLLMPSYYETYYTASENTFALSVLMTGTIVLSYSSILWFFWLGLRWILRRVVASWWPRSHPVWLRQLSQGMTLVLGIYLLMVPVGIMSWIVYDPTTDQASHYFKIHAAIKNTCLLDPQREHCPQQLSDLEIIEPAEYQRLLQCCQLNYTYDPDTNYYTLVVRYNPVKAVIFDQRLIPETGRDLEDVVVQVWGRDRVINPPRYDGPWTFPDWDYTEQSQNGGLPVGRDQRLVSPSSTETGGKL